MTASPTVPLAASSAAGPDFLDRLRALAFAGLPRMYEPEEKRFVFRLRRAADGAVVAEGPAAATPRSRSSASRRRTRPRPRSVLAGHTPRAVAESLLAELPSVENLGDVALDAVGRARRRRRRLARRLGAPAPRCAPTRASRIRRSRWRGRWPRCPWIPRRPHRELRDRIARRLLASQGPASTLFPHVLDGRGAARARLLLRRPRLPHAGAVALRDRDRRPRSARRRRALRAPLLRVQGPRRPVVVALRLCARATWSRATRCTPSTRTRWRRWRCSRWRTPAAPTFAQEVARGLELAAQRPPSSTAGRSSTTGAGLIWRKVARREPSKLAALAAGGCERRASQPARARRSTPSCRRGPSTSRTAPTTWAGCFLALPEARRAVARRGRAMTSRRARCRSARSLGVPVNAMTMDEVLDRVAATPSRAARRCRSASSTRPRSSTCGATPALREDVLSSDLILADGIAVVWAARLLGRRLPERVPGIDLMHGMLRRGADPRLPRLLPGRDRGGARRRRSRASRRTTRACRSSAVSTATSRTPRNSAVAGRHRAPRAPTSCSWP